MTDTNHMTATQATKTPGYNSRLEIYFTTDKNGKRRAFRFSPRQFRAFPIGVAEAELFIAQGQADQIDGNPLKALRG